MKTFFKFLESFNQFLTATEVLNKIKQSPQFKNREIDWEKYADRWEIQGEFTQAEVDPEILKKLINSQWLLTVQAKNINQETVKNKEGGNLNDIIIANRSNGQMIVVDGNHSLVAAIRSGRKVRVIFPRGKESNFGL